MTDEEKAHQYLATPAGFAHGVLGINLYPWQRDILNCFDDQHGRIKVAAITPNNAGKSSIIIPTIALRNLCTKPQGVVVITSKDSRQLDEQVWPALLSYRGLFKDFEFVERKIRSPWGQQFDGDDVGAQGRIVGFTTDDANRCEGWHPKFQEGIDSPLTLILDECKSIPDTITQAFSGRCTFNQLLYISSTGLMAGALYRAMQPNSTFKRFKIGLDQCPHISPERVADLKAEYAEDDPFLRSTLYAEFMNFDGDAGFFTTMYAIEKTLHSPPRFQAGEVVAACDFAGGGAENVLAIRRGNRVTIKRAWREKNEMIAVGEFIVMFREERLRPEQIWGDNAGFGKPIMARFSELGWPLQRFNGGTEANRASDYQDRNAEVWETGGRAIARGEVILPTGAAKLYEQLTTRKRGATPEGKLKAESKKDMATRGVPSPDQGDAVMMAIGIRPLTTYGKVDDMIVPSWMDHLKEEYMDQALERAHIAGCDTGL